MYLEHLEFKRLMLNLRLCNSNDNFKNVDKSLDLITNFEVLTSLSTVSKKDFKIPKVMIQLWFS